MTQANSETGQCLCGKVLVHAKERGVDVGACHCNTCRKWGGGPFMEVNCGSDVSFSGEEHVSVFDSSDWADRGFCSACGTHLFYRLKENKEYMVPVGLFEDNDQFTFHNQVFIDHKPSFYSFAEKTETLTGAELFAKFAPPQE